MSIGLLFALLVAGTFLSGMLSGIILAEHRKRKRPTIDRMFSEGVRDIKAVEMFAGLQAVSRIIITDLDGSQWKMSIEREKA